MNIVKTVNTYVSWSDDIWKVRNIYIISSQNQTLHINFDDWFIENSNIFLKLSKKIASGSGTSRILVCSSNDDHSSIIKYNLRIRNLVKTNLFAFFALNQGVIIDLNLQLILKCPCCPQFLHSLFGQFMVSWPTFALKSWHKKHTASIFLLKTWLNLKWNKINFDLWFFCFEYSADSTDFCKKNIPFIVKVGINFHNTHEP